MKTETFKSSKTDNKAIKHVSKTENTASNKSTLNKIKLFVRFPIFLCHLNNRTNKILLQTTSVKLVGKLSSKVIRFLYDPGSKQSFIPKNLSRQLSLNKVGEEELFIHTFDSKVPTLIKRTRVQVKIRDILNKDEVVIETFEIDEVTSAPLELALIDIINELKPKGINLCDDDYSVFGSENISLIIG
ncbi:hypothetical protein NPIL_305511 [Nephila pilipes]|uniref:Uncharacterized protein n=1 Tax=Nephila pilipes TaxID=299642 RepID=A0A8X6TDJ6_NEPPI|nr:hypothetical protein NPIL_305511 [Nephila pilipes]